MASIQQSLNQALYQTGLMKGIYKQSPEAQEKAKLKQEGKTEQGLANRRKLLTENVAAAGEYTSELETAAKVLLDEEVSLRQKQYQRDPENYGDLYLSALEDKDLFQTQGRLPWSGINKIRTASYLERQANLTEQRSGMNDRQKILSGGTDEVPTNRTKIMEV